jgi:hypothetical protein
MGTANNENERDRDDSDVSFEAWREQAASVEELRNIAERTADKLDGAGREIRQIASELRRLAR